MEKFKKGVNALSRASWISTPGKMEKIEQVLKLCQCPVSGVLDFYTDAGLIEKDD